MNWAFLTRILMSVPSVVLGIETLVQGAKQGATKKQLAMASLGLASTVASNVTPENQPAIDAATNLASAAIDNFVALQNAVGGFKQQSTPTSESTPATSTVVPVSTPAENQHVMVGGFPQ